MNLPFLPWRASLGSRPSQTFPSGCAPPWASWSRARACGAAAAAGGGGGAAASAGGGGPCRRRRGGGGRGGRGTRPGGRSPRGRPPSGGRGGRDRRRGRAWGRRQCGGACGGCCWCRPFRWAARRSASWAAAQALSLFSFFSLFSLSSLSISLPLSRFSLSPPLSPSPCPSITPDAGREKAHTVQPEKNNVVPPSRPHLTVTLPAGRTISTPATWL